MGQIFMGEGPHYTFVSEKNGTELWLDDEALVEARRQYEEANVEVTFEEWTKGNG